MTNHSHIAHRVFNRPHLVDPDYARVFVGALSERLDIRSLAMPDGTRFGAEALMAAAGDYDPGRRSIVDSVDGIAIIPIEGTLAHKYGHIDPYSGMTGYDGIQAKLEEALDDPSIRGILLDINSPGGEVSGCFDLADFIYESRQTKPIWAVADEWSASAAYALGSSAQRLIAPRTAELGSVGVLTMHVDHSQLLEAEGLDVTFIYAGDHKVDGNPFEPLPEDVRANIQADIDNIYNIFVRTVARNRGMSEDAVRETQAQVYQARGARDVGFADEVMAAREVLPAFDEYLRGQARNPLTTAASEANKMSLSIFGRRNRNKGGDDEGSSNRVERLGARTTAEDESDPPGDGTGGSGDGGEAEPPDGSAGGAGEGGATGAGEGEAGGKGGGEDESAQVATAEQVVALCTEANVPQMANGLIRSGATVAHVRHRIDDAGRIRDACAAAGVPHLADKAIDAIDRQCFSDFVRSALTELTAADPDREISHHQPTSAGRDQTPAGLDVSTIYARRRGERTTKDEG